MSGKTFKVKTADGETWEWDIHAVEETETKEQSEEEKVEWNQPAVIAIAVGLGLCFVGLLTLLISIGLLFSGPGALGGLIAGVILLAVGFVITTPSAIYLVKDASPREGRNRSESVAIILPTPEFRKNTVQSKPQEPSRREDRYLLAAERLTAMLEEPELEEKAVSTAAWTPSPSPMGSPRSGSLRSQTSFGSSLTIPLVPPKQNTKASPRIVRRVDSAKLTQSRKEKDKSEVTTEEEPTSATASPSGKLNSVERVFEDETKSVTPSASDRINPVQPIPEEESTNVIPSYGGNVDLAERVLGGPEMNIAFFQAIESDSTDTMRLTVEESERSMLTISETLITKSYTTDVMKQVSSGSTIDEAFFDAIETESSSGSVRLKVAAPMAVPSVTEIHEEDEFLADFLTRVGRQKEEATKEWNEKD